MAVVWHLPIRRQDLLGLRGASGMMAAVIVRRLAELVHVDGPAWPLLADQLAAATVPVRVVEADREAAADCLYRLQVTVGSVLGALAFNTGGVFIDHGWLRLLGSGGAGLADVATTNELRDPADAVAPPSYLVIGHDIVGGRFAVNGGALPGDPGEVHYWGPDTLQWQPLGLGHAGLVEWALSGGTAEFYASLRWSGWEAEAEQVAGDQGVALYPPPFTREGQDPAKVSRSVVPWPEIVGAYDEFSRQVAELAPGAQFRIHITDH